SPTQFTCSDKIENSANSCTECVSDAQCTAGRRCILTNFGGQDTGYFCLWKEGSGEGDAPQFCASSQSGAFNSGFETVSVDGEVGTYCKPGLTTCQGYRQFRNQTCTTDADCGV